MNKNPEHSELMQTILEAFHAGTQNAIAEHQKWLAEQGENTNTPKIANSK